LEGLKIGAAADILDALEDGAAGWDEVEARRLGGVVLRPDIAACGQGCAGEKTVVNALRGRVWDARGGQSGENDAM